MSKEVGPYIRLIGIWKRAQNACRSAVEDHGLARCQSRCLELLNLWPMDI